MEFFYEYSFELFAASIPIVGIYSMNNGRLGFYLNKSKI